MKYVDYINNRDDYECALLGALGFSTNYIVRKTGLSKGQISYRLKKGAIRRSDTRNGEGEFAQVILQSAREMADPKLMRHLKRSAAGG